MPLELVAEEVDLENVYFQAFEEGGTVPLPGIYGNQPARCRVRAFRREQENLASDESPFFPVTGRCKMLLGRVNCKARNELDLQAKKLKGCPLKILRFQ